MDLSFGNYFLSLGIKESMILLSLIDKVFETFG